MGEQESVKERMIRLEETQKASNHNFQLILQGLKDLEARMRALERWNGRACGFCVFAAFAGPFIIKAIFPKL